jgi:MFS superfamily sulfate permease-like transporter
VLFSINVEHFQSSKVMAFLISMLLPFFAIGLLVTTTSVLWWSTFPRPWLFVVLGTLIGLGIHRISQVLIEIIKFLFQGSFGGYFLEYRKPPTTLELAQESMSRQAFIEVAFILFLGYFALTALRQAINKG